MHVHACHARAMRTTIEIPDRTRAKLLELAARRGEKGFSAIVQEALEEYFRSEEGREAKVDRALAALGSFDPNEAERVEREVRELRRSWR